MSFTTVVQLLLTCQLTNQDWTICLGTKNNGLRIRWAQKLLYSHWSQALPNTQIIVLLVGKKVKLNMLLLVLTKARNGCNLRLLSLSAISFYRDTKISHVTEVVHITASDFLQPMFRACVPIFAPHNKIQSGVYEYLPTIFTFNILLEIERKYPATTPYWQKGSMCVLLYTLELRTLSHIPLVMDL